MDFVHLMFKSNYLLPVAELSLMGISKLDWSDFIVNSHLYSHRTGKWLQVQHLQKNQSEMAEFNFQIMKIHPPSKKWEEKVKDKEAKKAN